MATFHFDLVSPENLTFSGEVEQVDVPGAEGDFGVLAGHAPLVATLRPGIMTIIEPNRTIRAVITGGLAEVGPTGLTVLADFVSPLEDFDQAALAQMIKDNEEDLADSTDDLVRDKLRRKIDQMRAVQAAVSGVSTAAH